MIAATNPNMMSRQTSNVNQIELIIIPHLDFCRMNDENEERLNAR